MTDAEPAPSRAKIDLPSREALPRSYELPWPSFALGWCPRPNTRRFAAGSLLASERSNKVHVVDITEEGHKLLAALEHPFPPTKIMWCSDASSGKELLASSGNVMRIFEVDDNRKVKLVTTLTNWRNQHQQTPPPLTSFDWSPVNAAKLATSSVDTTITIWNVEREKVETQLIAHDKAVFDIAFAAVGDSDHLFASVGGDGSCRLFDHRNLDHSAIVYETQAICPLLRLAWCRTNTNHIATICMDRSGIVILDIRKPSMAYLELSYQDACVNCLSWSPHAAGQIVCGCEDGTAFIWDIKNATQRTQPSVLPTQFYECDELQHVIWPANERCVVMGTERMVRFANTQ